MISRSRLPRSTTPIKRKSRVKNVNRRRKAKEFARAYGSEARVLFVKARPCCCCGYPTSENAHIETGGMGRKAGFDKIVPLCGDRFDHPGCHALLHHLQRVEFERVYGIDLAVEAARLQSAWLAALPE